ncbi:hypothetical protein DFA_00693 [Cavenderia fasciculata]|uniref:EGF-like domain-containing protein n=1 Tax=Cavenderia fasciculata TaxID=261658 RepID=F4PT92_CACFS|nr:uncharacterized protein DFA_00693 [Cavenderia fasciculata]EGG20828.1 hypothetical protein DFA_00693 [Cavenderia fasciculata]|eukprot:XP_004358678.1 hypothetical protein DFA_00693 [Cavenderia fasciculata]
MMCVIKQIVVVFVLLIHCSSFIQFSGAQTLLPADLSSIRWIIRQYGSNIVEDSVSICASGAFVCTNNRITAVNLRPGTSGFIASGGQPPSPTTNIDLQLCTQFVIQPPQSNNYRGDPSQNILLKIGTGLPIVNIFWIFDKLITILPAGFFTQLPRLGLLSMELGITTLQDNQLTLAPSTPISQISLELYSLKSFPAFQTAGNSLMTSVGTFTMYFNTSVSDNPVTFNISSSIFKNLGVLELKNISPNPGTVSVIASCEDMFVFNKIIYIAKMKSLSNHSTYYYFFLCMSRKLLTENDPKTSIDLVSLNPDAVKQLKVRGRLTSTPPLHQFNNLYKLIFEYSDIGNGYPFTSFPPSLTQYVRQYSNITTFPSTPKPTTTFNTWVYHHLSGIATVPWASLIPDNTSRLLDLDSGNPGIVGTVPEYFCINKLFITTTSITKVPDCYWCNYNDQTIFKTSMPLPIGFTCQPTLDLSTIHTIGYRANLTGSLLGWGNNGLHPTQGNYTLTPIVPNKILELYYKTNNGSEETVSIKLNDKEAHTVGFTIQEVGIIFTSVNVTQNPNQIISFNWSFLFFNPTLLHNFTLLPLSLGRSCKNLATIYNNKYGNATVRCDLDVSQLNIMSFNFLVANAYNQQTYNVPFKLSGQVDSTNQSLVYLFGDFRQNHSLANITINDKIACSVVSSTPDSINCTLSESASYGPASVYIVVDGYSFISKDFLYFTAPPNNNGSTTTTGGSTTTTTSSTTGGGTTPQTQCQESTSNCFGHGSCDVNGRCQCDNGYNPLDNCLTKFTNSTPITNTTAPTSSFEIDGTKFDFELVAIQELDNEGIVIAELLTNSWNATITNSDGLTLVDYQLVNISNALYIDTIVQAMISFSTQPRDIQFGDQLLHINPNSIKLALNITNWQYNNLISTLRVVFRTDVNMNQTIEYDCKQQSISTFSYDQLSSTIQYLRVIKDNIQYNGRFIDYVLSDGRPTFSKTTLINQTTSQSSSTPTTMSTLIGVSLPQCQSCLLDPDFTPLLIDNTVSDCGDSANSKTWKIIVGVVVGGFAAIAITVGAVMLLKKNVTVNKQKKAMQQKLQNMQ